MPALTFACRYPVTFVPRGGRAERTARAELVLPVLVPEAGLDAAPSWAEVEQVATSAGRVFDPARAPTLRIPVHAFRGGLVRPWTFRASRSGTGTACPRLRARTFPGRTKRWR